MAVAARSDAEVRSELERLYVDHAQTVVRTLAVWTGSIDDAWDATQQAFLAVYGRLAGGLELRQAEAYLIKTAKDRARRRRSKTEREQPIPDDTAAGGQDVAAAGMAGASLIWEACRGLKPAYRTAVLMYDVEDRTAEEVGEYLGTSRFSAAKLVQRGRAEMLQRLVELVGRRRDCPAECAGRAATIWHWISGDLDFEARERLRLHITTCAYCRETKDQLRQARSLGVLPLLVPLLEILRRKDQVLSVSTKPTAARLGLHLPLRAVTLALPLAVLLVIGAIQIPSRLAPPAPLQPTPEPVANVASPMPSSSPLRPSPAVAQAAIKHPAAAAAPPAASDPCPAGRLGGFAYLSYGKVMYRSSPAAAPQVLDGTGRADDLRWTPNGATLVYKEVAASGSVAGSLRALHPGGAPFWSFGSNVLSYDISTDGGSIVALAQHFDASGNWDAWTLYIGPLGGGLAAHTEPALVAPSGPGWSESIGAEPYEEANYSSNPDGYWGVFWFGSTIYLVEGGEYATFDTSGNETASYAPQSAGLNALIASIGQPSGSAVHFTRRGVDLTSTCAGSTQVIIAPPDFLQYSSDTLMLCDDAINLRAGLAIEAYSGGTGGDVYLVTADRQVVALTGDHHSYLGLWRP